MKEFEREFFKLAGVLLACTHLVMGGEISPSKPIHSGDLQWHLLGMADYACEMRLLCAEKKAEQQSRLKKTATSSFGSGPYVTAVKRAG